MDPHSLFYANFFYAPLIALYCSYIWRVEHLNYNWNHLMTMPVTAADIFLSKLLLAVRCTVILQLWMGALFLAAGKVVGLLGLPNPQILICFCGEVSELWRSQPCSWCFP